MALMRDFIEHLKSEHNLRVDDKELESLLAGNKECMKMFLLIRTNLISKINAEDLKAQESKHRNYQRLLHSRSEVDKRREILKHRLNAKAKTLQTQASVKQRRDHFEYSKFVLQTVHTDLQNTSQLNVSQKNVNQFLHQIQDAIRSADFVFAEADLDSIDTQYNVFVKTTGLELEMEKTIRQINRALHFIHLNRVHSYDEVNVDDKFAERYLNVRQLEQQPKNAEKDDSPVRGRLNELKKLLEIYKSRRLMIEEKTEPKIKNVLEPLQSNQSINVL